jgi:citrate synthase
MTKLTEIGYATVDDIFLRGKNLSEDILGHYDFIDVIYLLLTSERPSDNAKRMINALLVLSCDHGLTPSSISTRLTYLGAPESIQGAVAAGLLGAGNRFVGAMQLTTEMLVEHIGDLNDSSPAEAYRVQAEKAIAALKSQKKPISGVGHPVHVNGDPRTPRMREIATECGYYGRHWRLMEAIADALQASGKNLPLNAGGTFGATIADMGLQPVIGRGLAIVGRAAGLLGHIYEEMQNPVGQKMWDLVQYADDQ